MIVLIVGLSCYYHFGEAILKNNENILLIFDYKNVFGIFANIFIVFFVTNGLILKYQPSKQLVTLLSREKYRDSSLSNFLLITLLHIA